MCSHDVTDGDCPEIGDGMEMFQSAAADRAVGSSLVLRVIGLLGCLAVAAIHVIDQGGVPGSKARTTSRSCTTPSKSVASWPRPCCSLTI